MNSALPFKTHTLTHSAQSEKTGGVCEPHCCALYGYVFKRKVRDHLDFQKHAWCDATESTLNCPSKSYSNECSSITEEKEKLCLALHGHVFKSSRIYVLKIHSLTQLSRS